MERASPERLWKMGERLALGFTEATREAGLEDCATKGQHRQPSQAYRTLFLQETIARGILMPSLVVSYSHAGDDIDRTIEAVRGALAVYRQALDAGTEGFLVGRHSKIAYRRYN